MEDKIGFGGGCHWCTEAVFQSLIGVSKVEQGFIASTDEDNSFSEAVIVHFNPSMISLSVLIENHLRTHKSTENHSVRSKYRSAIYSFSSSQAEKANVILLSLQEIFNKKLITKNLLFRKFQPSDKRFQGYYFNDPKKPFCTNYINPKLKTLLKLFSNQVNENLLTPEFIVLPN